MTARTQSYTDVRSKGEGQDWDVQRNGIISANDDADTSEISRVVVIQDSEKDDPSNNPAQI